MNWGNRTAARRGLDGRDRPCRESVAHLDGVEVRRGVYVSRPAVDQTSSTQHYCALAPRQTVARRLSQR